ncbi:hypothetical protein GCM10017750_52000 [Streptomyces racemochromogenes]
MLRCVVCGARPRAARPAVRKSLEPLRAGGEIISVIEFALSPAEKGGAKAGRECGAVKQSAAGAV